MDSAGQPGRKSPNSWSVDRPQRHSAGPGPCGTPMRRLARGGDGGHGSGRFTAHGDRSPSWRATRSPIPYGARSPRASLLWGTANPIASQERAALPKGTVQRMPLIPSQATPCQICNPSSPPFATICHEPPPSMSCTLVTEIKFAPTLREDEIARSITRRDGSHLRCEGGSKLPAPRFLHRNPCEPP